ncbi:MAG: phytoene/squalene synthase family protein [SAR202 cluster bacterium]|nr:phytoene/squalene synthase family protein [SAR202 cluster bacterium]
MAATELDLAYDHCRRMTRTQAKNFYYAFRTLPLPKRQAIYAVYAFCRLCDDIADEPNSIEEKRRLLAGVRSSLQAMSSVQTGDRVFAALSHAATEFGIPVEYLEEVVEGVEMDLTRSRYQTFDDLWTYCYKVASVAGLISIEIFGYTGEEARQRAIDLGIAMQLTNILRDLKEDAARDRIYIPQDELAGAGYSEAELKRGVMNAGYRRLMSMQVVRAREYFAKGRDLLPMVSARSRACPEMLSEVYTRILDRIEASGYDVFSRRIGLSKPEKLAMTVKLWAASYLPGRR